MIALALALYAHMAPVSDYLMDRNAEIALARSAAPRSISDDATIWVLTRHGYETAVKGTNGFVCIVERGFVGTFDLPEEWNPKIRGADCYNPPAARSVLPLVAMKATLVLTGASNPEVLAAIKDAYAKKTLPKLEAGAMSYMMGKGSYLTDNGDHNGPHLMFFMPYDSGAPWGADRLDSPLVSISDWFISAKDRTALNGLPPLRIFAVEVAAWSDGTRTR